MLVCENASKDVLHVQLTFNIRPKVRPEVRPKPLYTQAKACCWGYGPGHKGSLAYRPAMDVTVCTPYMCKGKYTTNIFSVGHTSTHIAPSSLPSCLVALVHQLPAMLGPATTVKAAEPSNAGSWACRQLQGSTPAPAGLGTLPSQC